MKKAVLLLLFVVLLTSCSDFLNRPVLGQENVDTYFKTEEECLKHISGCYQAIFYGDWWQIQRFVIQVDMCTDDMWMGNTTQSAADFVDLAHYTGNGQTEATQNYWQYRYKGIFQCNVAIEKISETDIADTELRDRLVAEAKFLRAYYYFDLIRNFGGVPIVGTVALPEDIKGIRRSTVQESYSFVEKDLLDAISVLPLRSEYAAKDLGRATKGAAQGLLAKVYLYQEKYEEAKAQLDALISSEEYGLLNDFGKVWDMDFNNSIESLFEVQTNSDVTYSLGERISVLCGSRTDSGWAWGLPTSDLEKAFEDAGDYERLAWTIIKHNATEVPGDPSWSSSNPYKIEPGDHKSARVSRKLYIPVSKRPTPYDGPHIPLNYRLLRFADVLLMAAEVENALGNDETARIYLNKVRRRVHLPDVVFSGNLLRDAIRLERRLELALESNRLYDLRRWKDSDGKMVISSILGPEGSFVKYNLSSVADSYEKANQKENSNKGYYFREDRDLVFPIPHSEITLSEGSIVQNPNYN